MRAYLIGSLRRLAVPGISTPRAASLSFAAGPVQVPEMLGPLAVWFRVATGHLRRTQMLLTTGRTWWTPALQRAGLPA
jgi:hypothetical protein